MILEMLHIYHYSYLYMYEVNVCDYFLYFRYQIFFVHLLLGLIYSDPFISGSLFLKVKPLLQIPHNSNTMAHCFLITITFYNTVSLLQWEFSTHLYEIKLSLLASRFLYNQLCIFSGFSLFLNNPYLFSNWMA